jgi:spore maturation protein CgeB
LRSTGNTASTTEADGSALRIFILDTYYPAFLAEHYRRGELALGGYEEQLAALMDRCFGTSDAYSRHLKELGHDAIDAVANCEPLQLRWAQEQGHSERGLRFGRRALRRIALDQIETFDPEVVYLQDLTFFENRDLDSLKRAGRFLAGQIASVLPQERRLRRFDLLLTSFPHYVERFRQLGLDTEYLKIAFDGKVLERLRELGVQPGPAAPREHGATFVGGLGTRIWGAGTRVLERAVDEAGLEVWGYGAAALPKTSPILSRYRGEAWGLAMYEVLARSRVALNRHGEIASGYANNMRLYEATGVGALLVTDAARNLGELFQPGREVVEYENEEDLIQKLRYYGAHDDERLKIAAAGQARTLREHTYGQRMAELATMLEERLR